MSTIILRSTTLALVLTVILSLTTYGQSGADGLATTGFNVELTDTRQSAIDLRLQLGTVQTTSVYYNGERYDRIAIEGATPPILEGRPELPAVVRYVVIPPQSGVELEIGRLVMRIEKGINPYPLQAEDPTKLLNPAVMTTTPQRDNGLLTDPSFSSHSGFWPPEPVQLGTPGVLRGHRIVPVITYPVRYNPQTGETAVLETADIRLNFDTDKNRVNLVTDPNRHKPSRYALKLLESLVVNPPQPSRDDVQNGAIAYVIGTGATWDGALAELQPLIEWRRRMGWTVNVIRVANTNDRFAVKAAILEAYNNWDTPPEHIVLVGDTDGRFPIAYFDMRVQAAYPYESDQPYAELEGGNDDPFPDVTISRFPIASDTTDLRGIVSKIVSYESAPVLGQGAQAGWQKRGAVCSVDSRSGLSSIDMCRWTKNLLIENGYTDVPELLFGGVNGNQPPAGRFVKDNINNGLSIFMFRGHALMGPWNDPNGFVHEDVNRLENKWALPFISILTCNTGDFGEHVYNVSSHAERFIWAPNGGAIGSVGCAGATHTAYNNLHSMSLMRALFQQDITIQGWMAQAARLELYSNYAAWDGEMHELNQGDKIWHTQFYITNMFGDPAVQLWTDVPTELEVQYDLPRAGDSRMMVSVAKAVDGEPLAGAQVCVYKKNTFQLVGRTDGNGNVILLMNPSEVKDRDTLKLTVTGYNLFPVLIDIPIGKAQTLLGVGNVTYSDANGGNGNGLLEPSETVDLRVEITNPGINKPAGALTLRLTPAPGLEGVLVVNDGEVQLDEAPAVGEKVTADFNVTIKGGFKVGNKAGFDLLMRVGNTSWTGGFERMVTGPLFEVVAVEWEGAPVSNGNQGNGKIRVANIGELRSPECTGKLVSFTRGFKAVQDEIRFAPVQTGNNVLSDEPFTFVADPFLTNGSTANLGLVLTAANGYTDTVRFSIMVSQAGDGDPVGPDRYGYLCMDDTDVDWFGVPVYNWIDISGNGTNLNLTDVSSGDDKSTVTDLPFEFQYYGKKYNKITVCTNGWAALGDRSNNIFAVNRRLPGSVVPAMLAPFWDDLWTTNGGAIFVKHIPADNIFVIQWNKMKRATVNGAGDEETFQILLYDPAHYPNPTGDGDIVFQYHTVMEGEIPAGVRWDSPYSTVGIADHTLTDGLQYSYWNERTPGAAPLEARRAIKFTTFRNFKTGNAKGVVRSALEKTPIAGARVSTNFGNTALTDDNGYYLLTDLIDPEQLGTTYTFTVTKQFYNDMVVEEVAVVVDDTVTVDIELNHPTFFIQEEPVVINDSLRLIDPEKSFNFSLQNTGDGKLAYTSKFSFDVVRDKPFDLIKTLNITQVVNNDHIVEVVYGDSLFYVFGGGDPSSDVPAKIYRFMRDGTFVDSLNQPWIDNWGARATCWDGEYLWGSFIRVVDGNKLPSQFYKFDPNSGEVLDSIPTPDSRFALRTSAYDPVEDVFYTARSTGNISVLNRAGEVVRQIDPKFGGSSILKRGLAWYPAQPDSLKLLILGEVTSGPIYLAGFNPKTGETVKLIEWERQEGDSPQSLDVTGNWNNSVWTMMTVISGTGADRVEVRELDPNTSWLSYAPISGELSAGESEEMSITLSTAGLQLGVYKLSIVYTHTASPGSYEIPVTFKVGEWVIDAVEPETVNPLPVRYLLSQNTPNPFNPSTSIRYTTPERGDVTLKVYDLAGRLVRTLVDENKAAGTYEVRFDGAGMSNGVYIYRLTTGNGWSQTRKMVLLK